MENNSLQAETRKDASEMKVLFPFQVDLQDCDHVIKINSHSASSFCLKVIGFAKTADAFLEWDKDF